MSVQSLRLSLVAIRIFLVKLLKFSLSGDFRFGQIFRPQNNKLRHDHPPRTVHNQPYVSPRERSVKPHVFDSFGSVVSR